MMRLRGGYRSSRLIRGALIAAGVCALAAGTGCGQSPPRTTVRVQPSPTVAGPAAAERVPRAARAPADLPVLSYDLAPRGFPADPQPLATRRIREGLHPTRRIAAYDAPGGRARAFLEPKLAGVPLTTPIVTKRAGWVAVMLPSANRRIAWIPPGTGWTAVPLRDLVVVNRSTHRIRWYRDGRLVRSWPVALGVRATPTPLGRTFILGRSRLPGGVYANTDVFALGSVPEDPRAVPASLRGAHIGIHAWYDDRAFGRNTTNGCIRLTRSGQRLLLRNLVPGTPVVVLDAPEAIPTPAPGSSTRGR